MKLFLIRHGQSEANLKTNYTGQTDVALTELGRAQATAAGAILAPYHFDKVYASDLQRARTTCECALPGVEYETLALLREYDVGKLAGVPIGSVKRIQSEDPADRPDYTDYGGENARMVCDRARTFLRMLEKEPYDCVAAFSHFGFINCILRTVLGTSFESNRIFTSNCAVHIIEYDGERWRILALNYGTVV